MIVQETIEKKLAAAFSLRELSVENESHQHSVPAGSESHFKVVLVSEDFAGLREVARHQKVYGALRDELAGPVHALALHTYTAEEWLARQQQSPDSPDCLGGSKRDG